MIRISNLSKTSFLSRRYSKMWCQIFQSSRDIIMLDKILFWVFLRIQSFWINLEWVLQGAQFAYHYWTTTLLKKRNKLLKIKRKRTTPNNNQDLPNRINWEKSKTHWAVKKVRATISQRKNSTQQSQTLTKSSNK